MPSKKKKTEPTLSKKFALLSNNSVDAVAGILGGVIEISFRFDSNKLSGAEMLTTLRENLEDAPLNRQLEVLQLVLRNLPDYVSSPVKLKANNIT